MLSGNKGEWSEIYTLLKLLGEAKVYAADSNLNKISDLFYPILKIIRRELHGEFTYSRESAIVIRNTQGTEIGRIGIEKFQEKSRELLDHIKRKSGRSFEIPKFDSFLRDISCSTLKAKHTKKRDITLVVHDPVTMHEPELGFSIKSKLGGDSTLLNASQATNFIYEITDLNLNSSKVQEINSLSPGRGKIMKRVESILNWGGKLEFAGINSRIFLQNLQVIDSLLPQILAEMLLFYYRGIDNKLADLVLKVTHSNPCGYQMENKHPFYEYKVKQFLNDVALGLTPTAKWSGMYDATGGYLIVKEDGEILCYHVYNLNEFQDYLLKNTRFETPSSSRHSFGSIYSKDNKYFFNLNLQIRFS